MPLSKRAKKVSLTKTKKKNPSEKRSAYVDSLRSCVEGRSSVFALRLGEGTRPTQFKQLRKALPAGSRLFLGKKSLMAVALGRRAEDEIRPNLHKLSAKLQGGMALIVTDEPKAVIEAVLSSSRTTEFATAGFEATFSLALEPGPLDGDVFPISMLDTLKNLGLPVEIDDAHLELIDNFVVAKQGAALSPEQAKLLKHLDVKMELFAPEIACTWVDGKIQEPS